MLYFRMEFYYRINAFKSREIGPLNICTFLSTIYLIIYAFSTKHCRLGRQEIFECRLCIFYARKYHFKMLENVVLNR